MINRSAKGRDFERQIVQLLKEVFPNSHRGRQNQKGGARVSPDIEGTPLWIECKRNKEVVHYNQYYDKASIQRNLYGKDKRPVAVIGRVDRGIPMIHIDLQSFIALISESDDEKEKKVKKIQCFKCSNKFKKEDLSDFVGKDGDRIYICPNCV